jgi:hypothetical protein
MMMNLVRFLLEKIKIVVFRAVIIINFVSK